MKKEENIRLCYGRMKERHGSEAVVLFHVGDFYEMYFDDAQTVARIADVPLFTMTTAGIPAARILEASMEECRNRLLDAGYKVCVSEVRGASGRHVLKVQCKYPFYYIFFRGIRKYMG